jgi:hypothetical protein
MSDFRHSVGTRRRLVLGVLSGALTLAVVSGCSLLSTSEPEDSIRIDLVAVLPVREAPGKGLEDDRPVLETHAGRAVTAQIYRFLAEQTLYRFVPDLTIEAIVEYLDRSDQLEMAREVAAEVGADAVLFGTVYRFQERVGTPYAATRPASVSFDLGLYLVKTDEIVWRGQFDKTQEALSSNLLNAWMFWRAGPHWFSVRELTRLGVERLLQEIPETVPVVPADLEPPAAG